MPAKRQFRTAGANHRQPVGAWCHNKISHRQLQSWLELILLILLFILLLILLILLLIIFFFLNFHFNVRWQVENMKYIQNGDTIVEVMISIVIAGVALALGYQLSNASLRTSTQASQRTQALAVSSAQIERLKTNYDIDSSLSNFKNTLPGQDDFCVGSNAVPPLNEFVKLYVNQGQCDNFEGTIFQVDDSYNSSTDTFVFTINWPNINGHGTDKQVMYYRFPT